ncbi:MAG: hypothetical protein ABIJ12_09600 [bacterium]
MLTLKRFIFILLAICVCMPSGYAKKKKPKAGEIENNIFTDLKNNYELTLSEEWKANVLKDDDDYRLILVQKNYEIPPDYIDAPDYTYVPRISVYICESNMSSFALLDSLLSDTYSSEIKSDIFKEFEILNSQSVGEGTEREGTITKKRKPFNVGEDFKGVMWYGMSKYIKYVTTSSSSGSGTRVYGDYQGGVIILELDKNKKILFHVMSEGRYFPAVWTQLETMVNSIKLNK